ncbi:MAG TPA: hypothetical protein VF407_16385 [Polyangiaceae bacterium]
MNCRPAREVIAQGQVCQVEECSCGVLHVTVGALTLRLAPEVVASLRDTLDDALDVLLDRRELARAHMHSQVQPS